MERWSGRQSGYVTTAPLVFVMNMFSNGDITTTVPLGRIVTLPIAAREMLCHVCKNALEQPCRVA